MESPMVEVLQIEPFYQKELEWVEDCLISIISPLGDELYGLQCPVAVSQWQHSPTIQGKQGRGGISTGAIAFS